MDRVAQGLCRISTTSRLRSPSASRIYGTTLWRTMDWICHSGLGNGIFQGPTASRTQYSADGASMELRLSEAAYRSRSLRIQTSCRRTSVAALQDLVLGTESFDRATQQDAQSTYRAIVLQGSSIGSILRASLSQVHSPSAMSRG